MFLQQVQRDSNQQTFWKNFIKQIEINMYIVHTLRFRVDHEMCLSNSLSRLERISTFVEEVSSYTSIPFELLPLFPTTPLLLIIAISNPFFSRNQDHLAHKGKFVNLSYMYNVVQVVSMYIILQLQSLLRKKLSCGGFTPLMM